MLQEQDFGVALTPDPQSEVWEPSDTPWPEPGDAGRDSAEDGWWRGVDTTHELYADGRRKLDDDDEDFDDDLEDDEDEDMYDDDDLDEDFDEDFDDDLDDDLEEDFEESEDED